MCEVLFIFFRSKDPLGGATTHYRKVDALYLLIHLEDTYINFWKRYPLDLPSPSPFVLPQCALLAGLHRPSCYVLVSSVFG